MDQCNRKLGFDSPKVIITMDMHYAFLIMIISAVDGTDGDLQGRETVPESWGLEGERETWIPCLRPLQVCLRATVFLILQRLVYFCTFIFYALVLTDLLRFAC